MNVQKILPVHLFYLSAEELYVAIIHRALCPPPFFYCLFSHYEYMLTRSTTGLESVSVLE
jgi:hypothetical protein